EDFKFQINDRKKKATKQERLPYPRFTKIIIQHILSENANLNKRSNSMPHKIGEEELMEKLKFVAKGEPKGTPTFGMPIPEAMMRRGQGKGYMRKVDMEINVPKPKKKKSKFPMKQRIITIAVNLLEDLDKALELAAQINSGRIPEYKKRKTKGKNQSKTCYLSAVTTLVGSRNNKPRSSSMAAIDWKYDQGLPKTWRGDESDKSDHEDESANSNNEDDDSDSDKDSDAEEDQTVGFEIRAHDTDLEQPQPELQSHSPSVTITSHKDVSRLEKHEKKLNDLAQINHAKVIEDSVKANMPKFGPKAVSDFVQPCLERIVLDVIKKNPVY
ncbi:hypothetical protein Tco_0554512, partial [Tanacetum coccineum]